MKTSSAKAKGRKLQQWFTKLLIGALELDEEDMESRPMGSQGEDIIMGKLSRNRFPYSIECKNQEAVNVWNAYAQAKDNCKGYEPLVVIKRNKSKPLVLVDAEHFVGLFKEESSEEELKFIQEIAEEIGQPNEEELLKQQEAISRMEEDENEVTL
tara:strand:- start:1353 stop:1817 length:465 start_codon:yes stop_codon:yes gene_type:complete